MASKKQGRAKRKLRKARAYAAMNGFTSVGNDNPFENTKVAKNASENARIRMQRRFNSELRRKNTFASDPNIAITKGYDATVSILGSALFRQIKESTTFDSYQLIDLVKTFDEDIDATVIEHALSSLVDEMTLPTYVNINSIQEALDAGFDIDEAIEYAELMEADVNITVTPKTVFTDLVGIIQDDLAKLGNRQTTSRKKQRGAIRRARKEKARR